MSKPAKHLHGEEAFRTECGLHSMRVQVAGRLASVTCEDCKRLRQERHEAKMASNPTYRRTHEIAEAFAAHGISVSRYAPIGLTLGDAEKVLRKLRKLQRLERKP